MPVSVEFHFDFASPNAYLCHKVIPAIEARTASSFTYMPVLLGGIFKLTNNAAPMVQFKDVKNKLDYQRREMERFVAKHGLTDYTMNPDFPVMSLGIMRGAVAAEMDGSLTDYVAALFHHMWEAPKKLDEPEIIQAALDESGFDGAAIIERTQDQAVKDRLIANTEASVARGSFGIPTFFVGDEMFFGKDSLGDLEDEIAVQTGG